MIGNDSGQAILIPDVANDGKVINAHYDVMRKCYWVEDSRGVWIEVTEASMRRRLRGYGLHNKPAAGEYISDVDKKLNEIQNEQNVAYAGPLAGHRSGVIECNGDRILVTTSLKLIEPVEGDWPVLGAFFKGILVDDLYDQRPYFDFWSKVGYEALRAGVWRPGQAMGLAGPRDCGKTLLQLIITLILGGRSAKPYRYMSNGTQFNADLFGAEHLVIDDEHSSTDIRARRALGSHIKQLTVNQTHSCHDKGRRALTLTPFWRLSISVNDEPEAMMVLPPVSDSQTDSLGDKLFLLRARKSEMPMPTADQNKRELFWQTLVSELPAYIYSLVNREIPEDLRSERFGIKTWHHPRLLASLNALAPEPRLLGWIDELIFADQELGEGVMVRGKDKNWQGTAEKLESLLFQSVFSYEAKRLLHWPSATGTYLGRLAGQRPDRVEPDRRADDRSWIIFPPAAKTRGAGGPE